MNVKNLGLALIGGWAAWRFAREIRRFSFRDKVTLVTGGSRGLGLVMARQLLDKGARVVICARDREEVALALDELQERGGPVFGRTADLADPDQATQLVDAVRKRFGRIDVVINNAGIIQVGPVESMSLDDFHEAMSNNFWSAVHVLTAAIPAMKDIGGGRIVNIASIGGKIAVPHLIPYCASKFALVGYSQGLRMELAKDDIVVTTVCPGLMRTGSHGHALFKGDHAGEYAWFSISGSLPVVTISAENAAAQILTACEYGDAEAILTLPAQAVSLIHQVLPQITSQSMALVNRWILPRGNDASAPPRQGFESHSSLAPSALTRLNEAAAVRNNQIPVDAG